MEFKFTKVRDVKSPSKGHDTDAGIDLFVPNDLSYELKPREMVKIPLGLKIAIPAGYSLCFFNKSGIINRQKLQSTCGVIDEDFQGEIQASMINISSENIKIEAGQKIVQGLLLPVPKVKITEVNTEEELHPEQTARGAGGFGSTGIK